EPKGAPKMPRLDPQIDVVDGALDDVLVEERREEDPFHGKGRDPRGLEEVENTRERPSSPLVDSPGPLLGAPKERTSRARSGWFLVHLACVSRPTSHDLFGVDAAPHGAGGAWRETNLAKLAMYVSS